MGGLLRASSPLEGWYHLVVNKSTPWGLVLLLAGGLRSLLHHILPNLVPAGAGMLSPSPGMNQQQ